eukprot:363803-Chlamydomonas_euryale.AAC.13
MRSAGCAYRCGPSPAACGSKYAMTCRSQCRPRHSATTSMGRRVPSSGALSAHLPSCADNLAQLA